MQSTSTLPDKPSELIRLALGDLELVEQDPRYKVHMNDWHWANPDGICSVCLAGCVMSKTLKSNPSERISPSKFSSDTKNKLTALDRFREGFITAGFSVMGINLRGKNRNHVNYADDSKLFKEQMNKLADDLAAEGL